MLERFSCAIAAEGSQVDVDEGLVVVSVVVVELLLLLLLGEPVTPSPSPSPSCSDKNEGVADANRNGKVARPTGSSNGRARTCTRPFVETVASDNGKFILVATTRAGFKSCIRLLVQQNYCVFA